MTKGCVTVKMSVIPGRVFTYPTDSPLAISFLSTNYNLVRNNTFAVVFNQNGVIVGQIVSDMVVISVESLSNALRISVCMALNTEMGLDGVYTTYDLGILQEDFVTILPLGLPLSYFSNDTDGIQICFPPLSISNLTTSLILIERYADYESVTTYTSGERGIVLTSGALFCFGACLVFFFNIIKPFKLASFFAGMQGMALLLFRGIYFFLLIEGDIPVGGLLDFALIEIPTFIYIGIFLRIIVVAYWLFFRVEEMKRRTVVAVVVFVFLLNWTVFAAIMIALAFADTSSSDVKYCDCQLSDPVVQSNVAQIIRLVYKSFVLLIAICVMFLVVFFGHKHVKSRNSTVFFQVVGLSMGLLCDCIAFLIYYALNSPTAYFLIVLWFTELLPICVANLMSSWQYIHFWFYHRIRDTTA